MTNNIWFYSDPHFGHGNIIKYANRPFRDVDHMNSELIRKYNSVVGKKDKVVWVGDCFFLPTTEAKDIMKRLNGFKILIRGNHDFTPHIMYNIGFDYVCESLDMKISDQIVKVSHYPYAPNLKGMISIKWQWLKAKLQGRKTRHLDLKYFVNRPKDIGGWLIHGHSHSKHKVNGRAIDVGVDAWNFKPVSIFDIQKIIKTKVSESSTDK